MRGRPAAPAAGKVSPYRRCRIRTALLWFPLLLLAAFPSRAADTKTCPGSAAVGRFGIFVRPSKSGPALPVDSVNRIRAGDLLEYTPFVLKGKARKKAKVAVVLVPATDVSGRHVTVLKVKRAAAAAHWKVPFRPSVVGLVLGPGGLSVKKVSSFVQKNPDLMPQMADYATRASTIEALVQTLSKYEQSKPGQTNLQTALNGFSSQYGVKLPAISSGQSNTEQASKLLQALLPAVSSSTPLTSRKLLLQGSTGLAASVATMFFGSPVGLAAGGATLFESLRTSIFPSTDFRAAFTQPAGSRKLTLCSSSKPAKRGTRIAYLWVQRIPDAAAPSATLVHPVRLPLDWTSTVKVTTASVAQLKLLSRARDWRLVSAGRAVPVPVKVAVGSPDDTLTFDFRHVKLAPGTYHLAAKWDWTPLPVTGSIALVPFPDLSSAAATPSSEDRLVENNGVQWIHLTGADFEFVDHAELVSRDDSFFTPDSLSFTLPEVKQPREQKSMDVEVDCNSLPPGPYLLRLSQRNGTTHEVPLTIHPPDPVLAHLPLRLNVGSPRQTVLLRGTGLARIEGITSPDAVWTLAPVPAGTRRLEKRLVTIALDPGARQGQRFPATLHVAGLHQPLTVPGVIRVIGPLPRIVAVQKSFDAQSGVQLFPGEIPADAEVSFLIRTRHSGPHPTLDLACREPRQGAAKLAIVPGTRRGSLQFDDTGHNHFFLSLDPSDLGTSPCRLTAAIANRATGVSAPFPLGRVVLLPRIEKFTLTVRKQGPNLYVGTLTGRNLQVIEKTGWNPAKGYQVLGIPTPVPGNLREQTLKIVMPWPPPSPRAPLYLWLNGESDGRRTAATY